MSLIIANYNTYGGANTWRFVPELMNGSPAFGESGSLIKIYNPSGGSYEFADLTFILDDGETAVASAQGEDRLVYKANVAAGHAQEKFRLLFVNNDNGTVQFVVFGDYANLEATNADSMLAYPPTNGSGEVDFSAYDTFWPEETAGGIEVDRNQLRNTPLNYKNGADDKSIFHTNPIDFMSGTNLALTGHSWPAPAGAGGGAGDPFVTPMIIV
jgi:hypothetical protein